MFAEFIVKPISGTFPEQHFGPVSPNSVWVKFINKNYEEWVGSFSPGWIDKSIFIFNFENKERAFIVAAGNGYMIDTLEKKLLNKDELSDVKTAIADTVMQRVIFSGGYDIQCVSFDGLHSVLFDKYYFDDIEFFEIRDNKLFARYWHYQRDKDPFLFEIDLATKEYKDSYLDSINSR